MGLDDEQRAEIEAILAERQKSGEERGSRPAPRSSPGYDRSGDWDLMGSTQQRVTMRQIVDERLAELDKEYEAAELKRRNKELEAQVAEWEKQGRKGRRPTRPASDDPPEERAPTIVSKAQKWLFGDPTPQPK